MAAAGLTSQGWNFIKRAVLAVALLVVSADLAPVRAQECPHTMMNSYGTTIVESTWIQTVCYNVPSTRPFYKFDDYLPMTPGLSKGPPGFSLSDNASYNNAWWYWLSTCMVNQALNQVNTAANADIKKDAGPLTGKGVTSFNFWQWVRLGQDSLQMYGKLKGMYIALKSGTLDIDIWKCLPKIAIDNSDDPTAPMLMMSVVPSSQSAMTDVRKLTDFSDFRYRLGTFSSRLSQFTSNLGLSFGTRPGVYAITTQLFGPSDPDNGWAQIYALQRSFHSTMTAMDMLRRKSIGLGTGTDAELQRRRGGTAFYEAGMTALNDHYENRTGGAYVDEQLSELKRGMSYLQGDSAALAKWAVEAASLYKSVRAAEQASTNLQIQQAFAQRYKAAAGGSTLNNITVPLETEQYVKSVALVEDLIKKYAGQDLAKCTWPGDEKTVGLGIETADAWVNRMIRDETRAMRQIYAVGAKIEMEKAISPYLAQAGQELQKANSKLKEIQNQVAQMENGQWAYDRFYDNGTMFKK